MPQHCEAADMLRFLFSFCGTSGDTPEVKPKEEEVKPKEEEVKPKEEEVKPKEEEVKLAFEKVRELANEPNSPLRKRLTRA